MPSGQAAETTDVMSRRGRSRRFWLATSIVVVVIAVAAGLGLWRWLHGAHVFMDGGNGVGGPLHVGHTAYSLTLVDAADDNPVTVDLRSVTPHVVSNTAHATIRVLECQENGKITELGAAPNVSYCNHLKVFTPGTHRFSENDDGTAIVLAITARQAGRVVIDGIDIRYHSGVRRGEQNTGLRMDFRAH